MIEYSVVIPAHNEGENIEKLVLGITSALSGKNFEIIVVNDNSSDNTQVILKRLKVKVPQLKSINRTSHSGVGNALREGYRAAKGTYIIQMDGDLSHNPAEIPKFIEKINDFDVVCGARYISGGEADMTYSRLVISKIFNYIMGFVLGVRLQDLTSGFRMYRRIVFDKITLTSQEFGIYPEVISKSQITGFRIGEVPIHYHRREKGISHLGYIRQGPEYLKILWSAIILRLYKS